VTGGAGFIGSHLVDRLLDENVEVTAIDDLSSGKVENIRGNLRKDGFHFVKCDIRDIKSVREALKGSDVVFHEGALTSIVQSMKNPQLANSVNASGTLSLLDAALNSAVKRFVYASSAAVYGENLIPQTEESHVKPVSPYGASKLAGENYVRVFYTTYGLETVCLRYFNVYGPRQCENNPYSGVITKFINRILNHQPLLIEGNGAQTRDFIHVEDVVTANLLALESGKAVGEVFNVGTGKETTVNSLAQTILALGNDRRAKIVHVKPRPGDIRHSCANCTKAQSVLGFKAIHRLEEELPGLVDWYRRSRLM
jgi:UDP-glucose 4-epimerase